ncbi:hypothetical protein Tco_0831127 [Tanacetum coccineum]
MSRTFIFLAIRRPASRASYSASLSVLVKLSRRAYVNSTLLGLMSTNPAPDPLLFEASSANKVHLLISSWFGDPAGSRKNSSGCVPAGASDKKSANTCPFIALLGSYSIFYVPNSTECLASFPDVCALFNICFNG